MHLIKTKIKNFRSYKEAEIELSQISVIIGRNDVGKSTLLDALSIFFENEKPQENDANVHLQTDEISITCFFQVDTQMPIQLDSGDSQNTQTTLQEEYLLNSDNLLQIQKIWKKGKLTNTYLIANYPKNSDWERPLIALKISELRRLIPNEAEVNKAIKKEMRKYLFTSQNLEFEKQTIDVTTKDTDIADIYNKLRGYLPKFALFRADRTNTDKDSEVNSVTKAIAQNAVSEVASEFANIKQKIKDNIQSFSDLTLKKLKDFNPEIASMLSVEMQDKPLESIFSYEFKSDSDIPLNKRGSGIKRLFLLSFFLADSERVDNANMIYAIEEPETSQHPDFQKLIIETLQKISQNPNRQILITTHTPEIVKMVNKDNIIFIKNDNGDRKIFQKENLVIKDVTNTLGILPYVSYKGVLFVEGETDIKFFKKLNDKFDSLKQIFDIETITLIPLYGGGNVDTWFKQDYLKESNIKQVFFKDKDNKKYQQSQSNNNNVKNITTKKREIENYFPIDIIEEYFKNKYDMSELFSQENRDNWDNEDIAKLIENKIKKIKEQDIKSQFYCEEIWEKLDENNINGFDEIKEWFEIMRDFFNS